MDKTEENREIIRNFLHDVMQGKAPEKTPLYFAGDTYIQHNTGIADGLSGLGAALEALGKQGIAMIYDTVHQVLAQGNYVGGRSLFREIITLCFICRTKTKTQFTLMFIFLFIYTVDSLIKKI